MITATRTRRRSIGTIIAAVLFALLAVNSFEEAFWSDGPPRLRVIQAIVGATAAATTWGAWAGARWSPALVALYGLIAGGMVVSLGPIRHSERAQRVEESARLPVEMVAPGFPRRGAEDRRGADNDSRGRILGAGASFISIHDF